MTIPTLTSRQQQLLSYIETTMSELGYPPTLYEMAKAMGGITVKGVKDHLKAIERKGYLRCQPGKRRAVEILHGRLFRSDGIPIVGRVAAGMPVLAVENIEGRLPLDSKFVGSSVHFALRVHGDSMTGAGIFEGDYIIVKQQETADSGDIVVALLGDDATVKIFRKKGREVFLEAANPAYPDIPLKGHIPQSKILGRVVGLYRVIR
ncbi:MAG: transcriptional repressor LexA [Nitrospira sp.]|nr:transcriptional repressor LexA [Nitrospira sp.]